MTTTREDVEAARARMEAAREEYGKVFEAWREEASKLPIHKDLQLAYERWMRLDSEYLRTSEKWTTDELPLFQERRRREREEQRAKGRRK